MDKIKKVFNFEIKQIGKEEDRTLEMVGSTEVRDRDGDEIMVDGWELTDYNNNPVIMGFHEYDKFPYGRSKRTYIDPISKKLKFEVQFPTLEELTSYPNSPDMIAEHAKNVDMAYNMYKNSYMRAVSVGFTGKEWEPIEEDGKRTGGRRYKRQSLIELSLVPIPSNPTALSEARSKGIISDNELKELNDLTKNKPPDTPTITVETRSEEFEIWKCPHCQNEIGEKELYHDGKNFYHSPCKDAGAILLPEKDCEEIKAKLLKPPETKKPDLEGNPSVWDITGAIRMALNPAGAYQMDGPWIEDLYPTMYPSGSVVLEKKEKCYLYQYDYKDGVATLSTDYIELEETYKPKSYEQKAGATISAKNRAKIEEAMGHMQIAMDMMKEMVTMPEEEMPMESAQMTMPMMEPMFAMSAMRTAIADEYKQALDEIKSQVLLLFSQKSDAKFIAKEIFELQKDAPKVEIDLDAIELPEATKDPAQIELEIEPGELQKMIKEAVKNSIQGGK